MKKSTCKPTPTKHKHFRGGGYYEIKPFVIKSVCRSSIFGEPFMMFPSVLRLAVYFGEEESATHCLDVDLIFFFLSTYVNLETELNHIYV